MNSTTHHIGILVGSLRKDSFSKKFAQALIDLAPDGFQFELIPIGELVMYNQDFDDPEVTPESYTIFRDRVRALHGVLFVTPEYNRSIPAVLKNALDVGSRPSGQGVWGGKPGAVISNSPGGLGAFGANHHLRQVLVSLNVPVMPQPEVYLSKVSNMFDEDGKLVDEHTQSLLKKWVDAYVKWFHKCQ